MLVLLAVTVECLSAVNSVKKELREEKGKELNDMAFVEVLREPQRNQPPPSVARTAGETHT